MHSFYGSQCPYCKKNFAEGDDIVVCPECGTPHHRECYKEHSACANEAHHAENFEWKPAFAPAPGVRHEHVHEAENVNSAEKNHCLSHLRKRKSFRFPFLFQLRSKTFRSG